MSNADRPIILALAARLPARLNEGRRKKKGAAAAAVAVQSLSVSARRRQRRNLRWLSQSFLLITRRKSTQKRPRGRRKKKISKGVEKRCRSATGCFDGRGSGGSRVGGSRARDNIFFASRRERVKTKDGRGRPHPPPCSRFLFGLVPNRKTTVI